MNFIAPLAALSALIAAPIIALYMLRLRRREVVVPSNFLWQQVLQDREANAPWQKLKRNLLLFLQLLILAALVFSLMRPFIEVPTVTVGRTAIVLDASASMSAIDVAPSRFEAAKAQVRTLIDAMNPGDQVALIVAGTRAEVAQNYTGDKNLLLGAVDTLPAVGTGAADWGAALTLAAAGGVGAQEFSILLVSDGGLSGDLATTYGDVKFVRIGTQDSNVGISALSSANDPANGAQIYARLTNYGSQPAEVIFSVELDSQLFEAKTYNVPASSAVDVILNNLPDEFSAIKGQVTYPANSTVQDFFPLDDTAYAVFDPATAGDVLLLTRGNRFLEQGFSSLTEWTVFAGDVDQGIPEEPYDLYVFDSWLPDTLPDANMLIINPPNSTDLFTVGAETTQSKVLNVLKDDPRTRYLKFNDVNIRSFRPLIDLTSGETWSDALVTAQGGDMIVAGTQNGRRIAVIGFALQNSDLPLRIAYPILLANLTEWYRAPRAITVQESLTPGQTLSITPRTDAETVRVTAPDGAITTLTVDKPVLIMADTRKIGLYTVDVYKGADVVQSERFAVNLFDPNESQIATRTPVFGTTTLTTAGQEERGQREFWPWLALAALAVLMLEWLIYHRRAGLQLPRLFNRPTSDGSTPARGFGLFPGVRR